MEKAVKTLSRIQDDDDALKAKIDADDARCKKDISEIMIILNGLKKDLMNVAENVRHLQNQQYQIDKRIQSLINRPPPDRFNKKPARRSRSADVAIADHDSGIHCTNGGVFTDHSSSPPSGRASPTSALDSTDDDIVHQNRILTSSLKSQLVPSYSTPLLCLISSDKQSDDDSELEMKITKTERFKQKQAKIQATGKAGRKTAQIRRCKQENSLRKNEKGERDECLKILADLVCSEKDYCNRLWHLQANVYEPLKEANLISQKDLNSLFPHELKLIYEQHCVLLHKLETRLSSWSADDGRSMSALFRPQFDARSYLACIYTDYAYSFSKITDAFKENVLKNTDLIKYLKSRPASRRLKEPEVDLRLDAFLVMPLERVSHYIRVLKKLLTLHQAGPEQQALICLVENLQQVAADINKCIKRALENNNNCGGGSASESSESSDKNDSKKIKGAAATAMKKQLEQQQLKGETTYDQDEYMVEESDVKRVSTAQWAIQTFPRRESNTRGDKERFLTFGRPNEKSSGSVTTSKGPANTVITSQDIIGKSKQITHSNERDTSQASSLSGGSSSGSPLQSLQEEKMPITIKEARTESPPPMPLLRRQRSRTCTRGNVVPIRYTKTVDFDTETRQDRSADHFRSVSVSPCPPFDHRATGTMTKQKGKLPSTTTKSVNSIKNSLAAFFSKRKNEQRFRSGQRVNAGRRGSGVHSYSLWTSTPTFETRSEAGSSNSPITLASNPNIRLLAGAIPRPRYDRSIGTRRDGDLVYGLDYQRRDSIDTIDSTGQYRNPSENGAFVTNSPLYWWHKENTSVDELHGNGCDFVQV